KQVAFEHGGSDIITIKGQSQPAPQWLAVLEAAQADIAQKKESHLSRSPVLALLVARQDVYGRLAVKSGDYGVPKVLNNNPYDNSLLAKKATPESDEEVRGAFAEKLVAVKEALRRTRAEAAGGDIDFLLGMDGLRRRVKSDLGRLGQTNA